MLIDGSNVLRLLRIVPLATIFSSCPEKVDAEPVKLSLFLFMIPVTTTSLMLIVASFRVTMAVSCPV